MSQVTTLVPVRKPSLDRKALWSRWKRLPAVDLVSFRDDIDADLDPSL